MKGMDYNLKEQTFVIVESISWLKFCSWSFVGGVGKRKSCYNLISFENRYKVFLDLFNMSTFLIPRNLIPPLTPQVFLTKQGFKIMNIQIKCYIQYF